MSVAEQIQAAKSASRLTALMTDSARSMVLRDVAKALVEHRQTILEANQKDLEEMEKSDPRYDRLLLTPERIQAIAYEMETVAAMESPTGRTLEERNLKNGLHLKRVTVPLGVIGIVYEARPNVTCDVFALCFKSGNSCLLKGGSDAKHSNEAIVAVIHDVLDTHQIPETVIALLPPTRPAVEELLDASETVDVIIPRGSKALIDFVRDRSRVPVIETGAGVVHTYVDETVDLELAEKVITNAKTRRVSVCNALDTLLVHQANLASLPKLCTGLAQKQVAIFADERAHAALDGSYPHQLLHHAEAKDFGIEFLDYKMSIRTVESLDQAIEHIAEHSSRHSEAILSENPTSIETFLNQVDAAVVYANASTAFTDGAQFGLGAEIGISTQKLPPRGPMGIKDLVTYKWKVEGQGQTRP